MTLIQVTVMSFFISYLVGAGAFYLWMLTRSVPVEEYESSVPFLHVVEGGLAGSESRDTDTGYGQAA